MQRFCEFPSQKGFASNAVVIRMQMFWGELTWGSRTAWPIAQLLVHLQAAGWLCSAPGAKEGLWGIPALFLTHVSHLSPWQIKLNWGPDPVLFLTEIVLSLCQNPRAWVREHTRNSLPVAWSVLFHPHCMLITRIRTYCGGGSYFWMLVKIH